MAALLDVERLLHWHESAVERWHAGPITEDERDPLWGQIQINHARNFQLWHEEDKARDPRASDAEIARVKRAIDRLNQQRNDAIERMDECLLAALAQAGVAPPAGTPLNTETPGSVIDRLSILALKVFHMREESERRDADAAHRERAAARLAILVQQREDLAASFAALLKDIATGRKRLKVYRQMKMYNDPTLNPVLYRAPGDKQS